MIKIIIFLALSIMFLIIFCILSNKKIKPIYEQKIDDECQLLWIKEHCNQ